MGHCSRHAAAGIGALAAYIRAVFHLCVTAETVTIVRTSLADLGAYCACVNMQTRSSGHKIRAGLANIRAIHQQPNMTRVRVFSTLL
jgi:hypothetical protein